MHILIWVTAAVLLALWSLVAWGLAALLGIDPGVVGDVKPLIAQIPYGEVIDVWVPGWEQMLLAAVDLTRTLLGWLGSAGSLIVWLVWGFGTALIVGAAAVGSVIVALIRKASGPTPPSQPARA